MTSAYLKALLPNDNREVLVWVEVDGNWKLFNVKSLQENSGAITLDLKEKSA